MSKKQILPVALLSMVFTGAVGADTHDDLATQLNELRGRLEKVEQAEAKSAPDNSKAGEIQVPGTNTTINFGGYVQGDLTYDVRVKNGGYFNAGSTTRDSVDDEPEASLRANQSRFNVTTSTSTPSGKPVTGFFEIDFMGEDKTTNEIFSNSEGVRLRHAYLSYDGFLVGQYWSNFQDFAAYPVLLDVSSPAGRVFVRQPQIRYTVDSWALSLENPETQPIYGFSNQAESLGGIGEDTVPDMVLSWRHNGANSYQVSGVLRRMGVKGTVSGVNFDDTETGWGVNVAGRWGFGNTTLKANTAIGDGIGRYINNGFGNGLRLHNDGSVSLIESYGVSAALEQRWTNAWKSTFSYGLFKNESDFGAYDTDQIETYRANIRYDFAANTMIGAEVMYATRDFIDGEDGDNTRFQLSVRHGF
jgi:hypothetical protein